MPIVEVMEDRINIAMFSTSLPRPFASADARWLFVCMNEITRRGHNLELISCTESSEQDVADAMKLAAAVGCTLHHVPMVVNEPRLVRRFRSLRAPHSEYARVQGLSDLVNEVAKRNDLLHVEHLFPSWLALERSDTSVFLHHLESIDWTGPRTLTRAEKLQRFQTDRATAHLIPRLDRILAATPRIRDAVLELHPEANVEVVSVAIDTSLYDLLPPVAAPVVGVVGSMHWYPSRSAAERVLTRLWPAIHQAVPDAELIVAGFGADRYLGHLFPVNGARLLGTVARPEDFFGQASVLLYPPERGSGMKIKALESFAYGVPVISNAEGLEGLGGVSGTHYIQGETDDELIAATISLLRDHAKRLRMRAAARDFIEVNFSPQPAVDRLFDAWEKQHHFTKSDSLNPALSVGAAA